MADILLVNERYVAVIAHAIHLDAVWCSELLGSKHAAAQASLWICLLQMLLAVLSALSYPRRKASCLHLSGRGSLLPQRFAKSMETGLLRMILLQAILFMPGAADRTGVDFVDLSGKSDHQVHAC